MLLCFRALKEDPQIRALSLSHSVPASGTMEKTMRASGKGELHGNLLVGKLPQSLLLEILSRLDLESLCSAAPVCRYLRSSVSQTLFYLSSLDLSGFSPRAEILSRVVRESGVLRSLTLDCSRLDDSSIQLLTNERLEELVLLKCFNFSSYIFTAIGEKCSKLRGEIGEQSFQVRCHHMGIRRAHIDVQLYSELDVDADSAAAPTDGRWCQSTPQERRLCWLPGQIVVKGLLINQLKFNENKLKNYSTTEEYAQALSLGSKNGGVAAIFDELPYLKLFLSNNCATCAMLGETYRTDGFGFIFPRGSPLVSDVSRAILNVTEGDAMAGIERKWFGDQTGCPTDASGFTSGSLSFGSFSGLFLMTGCISSCAFLIFLIYKKPAIIL